MTSKIIYRRNLPHIQPIGETFFVTYNLKGSIPPEVLASLQEEYETEKKRHAAAKTTLVSGLAKLRKKHFVRYDQCLDASKIGPHYLKEEAIAQEVAQSLHFWDDKKLELICYCIMSNHVHAVLKLFDSDEENNAILLHKVLQSIKRHSAREANELLGREGQFWHRESFDYLVRDRDELYRIIEYVLDNPVKAGLCLSRNEWKWSYIKPEYNEFM